MGVSSQGDAPIFLLNIIKNGGVKPDIVYFCIFAENKTLKLFIKYLWL